MFCDYRHPSNEHSQQQSSKIVITTNEHSQKQSSKIVIIAPSNEHSQQQSSKTVITAAAAMNRFSNKVKLWLPPPQQWTQPATKEQNCDYRRPSNEHSQQQRSKTVITAAPAMKQPAKQ